MRATPPSLACPSLDISLLADLNIADSEAGYESNARAVAKGHRGISDPARPVTPRKIVLRNMVCVKQLTESCSDTAIKRTRTMQLLAILVDMVDANERRIVDRLVKYADTQWLLLFISAEVMQKSVILSMRILVTLLVQARAQQSFMNDFRSKYMVCRDICP